MSEPPSADKTALITGASSGIGAAIARELARHGLRVGLVARRLERLQSLVDEIRRAGGQAEALPTDLAQESQRQELHQRTLESLGQVDVLVNNAGLGWYGFYAEMPWETAQEMLQVNISAVALLTRLFLPGMRARGRGHIINVG